MVCYIAGAVKKAVGTAKKREAIHQSELAGFQLDSRPWAFIRGYLHLPAALTEKAVDEFRDVAEIWGLRTNADFPPVQNLTGPAGVQP